MNLQNRRTLAEMSFRKKICAICRNYTGKSEEKGKWKPVSGKK